VAEHRDGTGGLAVVEGARGASPTAKPGVLSTVSFGR